MPSGIQVLGALHEGREIRIGDREAHRADDLAARFLEGALERAFGVVAGAEVGDHGVGFLHAVLRRPGAERLVELRRRHRGARHVGRLGRDDRGRGIHHDHELLRLGRHVAGRQRIRRQREARQDIDLVAHDQLLREALGHIRRDAADVLADHLDLLAGDGVAMLLHVELDAVVELDAGVGELAGIRQDHADLDRVLRASRARRTRWRRRQARASSC